APYHIPFAQEAQTLSPVYEPGPSLTAIAAQSFIVKLFSANISWIYFASNEACAFGWFIYFSAITLLPKERATEQDSVAVSKSSIKSDILELFCCCVNCYN
ncbi:MAG: hypothetical protein RR770_07500, partial [Bacteroidales bacterium]